MSFFEPLLEWINAHPNWAWGAIFTMAVLDSLFVVGVLLPGAMVMVGAGALVALGVLDFWTCVQVGVVGAVVGDLFNYWLGRHFRERLFLWKPVAQNQEAIQRGMQFFARHGGKSVLLGRFVGLLRPLTPAIAGVSGMKPAWFVAVDVVAGISWSLVYTSIGVAFGASLGLAAQVGARLATLIVALLLLLWSALWLTRRGVNFMQRHAEQWTNALLDWSHHHRRLGRLGEALADPNHPETPALAVIAGFLLATGGAWLTLWWGLGWREYPPSLDALAFQTLKELQTPFATALAVALAQLGEWQVYGPVAIAGVVSLAWKSRDRALSHWLAAIGFGALLSLGLFALPTFTTPFDFYFGEPRAYFSGRELVLATVIYGFIPVLLSTRRKPAVRVKYYAAAITLLLLILLAELYLGAQWLTMGLFAVITGALWVAALGVGYRRHRPERVAAPRFMPIVGVAFVAAAALHWSFGYAPRLDAAIPRWPVDRMSVADWIDGGFGRLPAQRVDMAGRPKLRFNLQWAGDLQDIESAALAAGWEPPVELRGTHALRWLASEGPIADLPLLPLVHAGRHQALVLRRTLDDERQLMLQLWPSTWMAGGHAIWVGNISVYEARTHVRVLRYPVTQPRPEPAVGDVLTPLAGFEVTQARDAHGGPVWLVRPVTR